MPSPKPVMHLKPWTVLTLALLAGRAPAAGPTGDPAAGQRTFSACASCHQVGPSARNGFGPQLNGIIGRRAGTAAGYNYSSAMKGSAIVWSPDLLAAFVRDPGQLVPGTKMRFSGFGYSDQTLADLAAYLRKFPPSD